MSEIKNWHYIDGPRRVGPFDDVEWAELVDNGTVAPETRVWNEQLPEWAPYATVAERFPLPERERKMDELALEEFQQAQTTTLPGASAPELLSPEEALAFEQQALAQDYQVSARACVRRSWLLYREQMVTLSGVTLLSWFIISIGSSLPSALALIMPLALNGVFQGGLYAAYLKALRGDRAAPGDLFTGFRKGIFSNLVMRTLMGAMVLYACLFAGVLALRTMGLKLEDAKDPAALMERVNAFFLGLDGVALLTVALLLFVCMLPAIYLGVCWLFSVPLIRDCGLPWPVALRLSRLKVQQHPVRTLRVLFYSAAVSMLPAVVATFVVGMFFTTAAPFAMMLVGVLFSMPLFIGSMLAFYESVFYSGVQQGIAKPEPEATREA